MARRIQRRVQRPAAEEGPAPTVRPRVRRRRVATQAVNEFTVQFATLSAAGIPIVRALSILERQARPGPFKAILGELVEDVSAGTPLSEALAKHEGAFDRLYSAMVRAGETGGILDAVLERLAEYRERTAALRTRVAGALVYPLVVVLVSVAVVAAVVVLVIPKFELIFDSFDVELPGPTRLLLAVSDVSARHWYLVLGVPVLLLLLHGVLFRRGGGYRRAVHASTLRLPVLGRVVGQAAIAAFSRTFGTLLQAGVTHVEALGIVRDTSSNDVLAEGVETIRLGVQEGEPIAGPMAEVGVFDELVRNMVDVGEQTGELDRMLIRVADAYERQVDHRIELLFKILQPAVLIVVAAFVGFIVVSLFLPLMRIMGTLNQP